MDTKKNPKISIILKIAVINLHISTNYFLNFLDILDDPEKETATNFTDYAT